MDEYTLQILDDTGYNYLKNGKLHREAGPAVFTIHNKECDQLLNLDDKDLYKEEKVSSPPDANPVMFGPNKYYYLEGARYSEDDFHIMVLKINLEKELSEKNQTESKKAKI